MTTFDIVFSLHLDDIPSPQPRKRQMLLWFQSPNPQTFFNFFYFGCAGSQLWHAGCLAVAWDPCSPTRHWTWAPCTGPTEKFPQPSLTPSCSLFSLCWGKRGFCSYLQRPSDPLDPSLVFTRRPSTLALLSPSFIFHSLNPSAYGHMSVCSFSKSHKRWVQLKHSFGPTAPSPDTLLFSFSQQNFSKCMSTHCLHQTPFSPPLTALNRVTDKLHVAIPKVVPAALM